MVKKSAEGPPYSFPRLWQFPQATCCGSILQPGAGRASVSEPEYRWVVSSRKRCIAQPTGVETPLYRFRCVGLDDGGERNRDSLQQTGMRPTAFETHTLIDVDNDFVDQCPNDPLLPTSISFWRQLPTPLPGP